MSSPSAFYAASQNITILMADGVTQLTISLSEIDDWHFYGVKTSINYGAQIGGCLTALVVTAVLTRESQRVKPIYFLNIASLFLGILRPLLIALWSVSDWQAFFNYFSHDKTFISANAIATSVAATVIPLLMTITVNMSLVLQAHTVCKAMRRKLYYAFCALAVVVLWLAIGFRFAECVTNTKAIMSNDTYYSMQWITTGTMITETISIWFFSLIFSSKLVWTIRTRKKNGWRPMSATQVLAIMSLCTMIIPSIFAILEYTTMDSFPEAGMLAITWVAILLPLSALWAGMATDSQYLSFNFSSLFRSRSQGDFSAEASQSARTTFGRPISPATTDSSFEHRPRSARDSTELALEAIGVRVDYTDGVCNGKSAY